MEVTNAILLLQLAADLALKIQKVVAVIQTAQMEGRDVTKEELAEAKASAKAALDELKDALHT